MRKVFFFADRTLIRRLACFSVKTDKAGQLSGADVAKKMLITYKFNFLLQKDPSKN